ncbi:MAG TPA: hypothetical protein VFR85_01805 [Anaeromyxobacteraceae bacterium]|nr:hypothetical protein [Anaeromyxobacteraceae bacterium]
MAGERQTSGTGWDDVRLRGFADRASLEQAQTWPDGVPSRPETEEVEAASSVGRVLAAPLAVPRDHPPADRASVDGYAVRSAETVGSSAYQPVPLRLQDPTRGLAPGAAALVAAGAALPEGADAILGFDAAQAAGAVLESFPAQGSPGPRAGAALLENADPEVREGLSRLGFER